MLTKISLNFIRDTYKDQRMTSDSQVHTSDQISIKIEPRLTITKLTACFKVNISQEEATSQLAEIAYANFPLPSSPEEDAAANS